MNRINLQKNFGFTLAEVLITLGIIGVIAAMTLPSLVAHKTGKELEAALKKNYSVASQALMSLNYDQGAIMGGNTYEYNTFKPLYIKYFKTAKDCQTSSCVNYSTVTDADGNQDNWYIANYKTYSRKRNVSTDFFDDGQFVLQDGSFYIIENPHQSSHGKYQVYISIDVNGYHKRPNAWGQDLFTFQVRDDGKLLPMGADGTDYTDKDQYCSPSSNSPLNGIACTYDALYDKSFFNNLP